MCVSRACQGEARFRTAVRERFLDEAISVREAAVDLVGRFILHRKEFADAYYEMVLQRLFDKVW